MRSARISCCAILGSLILAVSPANAANNRLFPVSPPPAPYIDVVDVGEAAPELALMATTLQGVANAGSTAQIYLRYTDKDSFWMDWMTEKGWVSLVRKVSLAEIFKEHEDQVKIVYLYDPELPASLNIATMLAALHRGVVATPALAARFFSDKPVENLAGRWTSNAEAYEWAFQELWPELNHAVIACLRPDPRLSRLRDYLIQHKVFTFWPAGEDKESADLRAREQALAEKVLAATPINTPVMGFWFNSTDAGITEYNGVGLAGEYGKITVVTDGAANLSMLAGMRIQIDGIARKHHQLSTQAPPPPLRPDKVYIGVNIMESGDAPGYLQGRQLDIWNTPGRGDVPIGWAMGLPTIELMPAIAAYYMEKATAKDHLFAAVSGAGYTHPYRRFMSRTDNPEGSWRQYLTLTNTMMGRAHFTEMGVFTDSWKSFERSRMDTVTKRIAEGVPQADLLLLGLGRDAGINATNCLYPISERGTIVSHILTRWPADYADRSREDRIAWLVEEIKSQTPKLRPAFMQVMALSWAYTPAEIAEVFKNLGDTYVPVSLAQYRALVRGG